jgi:hypothetical protein
MISIAEHLVPNLHDSGMHVQVEASVFLKLLALREVERARKKHRNHYQLRAHGMEAYLRTLGVDLCKVVMDWFSTFFLTAFTHEEILLSMDCVPASTDVEGGAAGTSLHAQGCDFIWRFLDEVMLDGWPVLFRAGLAFLTTNEDALRKCTTKEQALAVLLPYIYRKEGASPSVSSSLSPPSPRRRFESSSGGGVGGGGTAKAVTTPTWTPTRPAQTRSGRRSPSQSHIETTPQETVADDTDKCDGGGGEEARIKEDGGLVPPPSAAAVRLSKLAHLAVGNPVAQSSLPSYLQDALSTFAPSNQWLRDARRPAWNEVHIVVAGWRRRMEQRSAAVLSVRSICQNLISTLTVMWTSLPRPSEAKDGEVRAMTAAAAVAAAAAAAAAAAGGEEDPQQIGPSPPIPLSPGRGGQEAERRHLRQRLDNLRKILIRAMDDCHVCARRAIEASDTTCRMIDKSWMVLCAHEEEARKRGEGFDGFIPVHKSPSSARKTVGPMAGPVTGERKNDDGSGITSTLFDPVFTALLDSAAVRPNRGSLCFGVDPFSTAAGSASGSGSAADSAAVRKIMQKQMHAIVDAAMAVAWTCLATCWSCKHWLAKDMWWCCTWAPNTHAVPSPEAVLPMQLVGAEITAVPAKASSTDLGAAKHRRVCISTFDTFFETATALAKATERLLRCDIAGQRSDGGSGGVVLAPELTGNAEPRALKQAVKQLGKLRRGLGLLESNRTR